MDRQRERQTEELANSYLASRMSRRTFVMRLLALGLAPSAVGAIVAACGSSAATSAPSALASAAPSAAAASALASLGPSPSPSPADLKGTVRFLIGPWSSAEVDHHKHIAQAFNAIYPNVKFDYRLYQWDTASQEINTSLTEGAHDI